MASFDRIDAIPTRFMGVDFRSILEARWACMFTLMGLHWEYETVELGEPGAGFIPDFIVDVPLYAGPDRPVVSPVLVEVKPNIVAADYRDPIAKVARSGWTGAAMVLGCVIREREFMQDEDVAEHWCGYAHPAVRPFHAEPVSDEWFQVGVDHGSVVDGYMFAFGGTFNLVPMWREAGNRVKWSPYR